MFESFGGYSIILILPIHVEHTNSSSIANEMTNTPTQPSDAFSLYDLKVSVLPPKDGSRIMCGAKEGDYFTLEGEMLYLPAGQGISIYSLGKTIRMLIPFSPP